MRIPPYTSAMGQSIVNFITKLSEKEIGIMVEKIRHIRWHQWIENQRCIGQIRITGRNPEHRNESMVIAPQGDHLLQTGPERDLPSEFLVRIFQGYYDHLRCHQDIWESSLCNTHTIDFKKETLTTRYQRQFQSEHGKSHTITFTELRETKKYEYMEQLEWLDISELRINGYGYSSSGCNLARYQKRNFWRHPKHHHLPEESNDKMDQWDTIPMMKNEKKVLYAGFREFVQEMRPNARHRFENARSLRANARKEGYRAVRMDDDRKAFSIDDSEIASACEMEVDTELLQDTEVEDSDEEIEVEPVQKGWFMLSSA